MQDLTKWLFGTALAGALLAFPAGVAAQQGECPLTGSNATNLAAAAFEEADQATRPEDERAAYAEAVAALQPEMTSDNPAVFLMAANAQMALGEYDAAEAAIERFSELAEGDACDQHAADLRFNAWVRLYNEAIEAYSSGDNDAALASFERANDFHPDPRSLNNAAVLHMEEGNSERAIALYEEAIAIEDAEPASRRESMRGLGDLLLSEGRTEDAMAAYSSYLEQNPDDVAIEIRYGLALSDAGQVEESAAIFSDVLSRDDLTAPQWVEVGVGLYNSESFEDAMTAFGNARTANPYNKEAMENYVNSAVRLDDEPDASVLALADTLVAWYPAEASTYQLRASALAAANNSPEAMRVIQQGEGLDPEITSVQMGEQGDGSYIVRGSIQSPSGNAIELTFEFLGADGTVVATETLSIPSPAAGQTEAFDLTVTSDQPIVGFRYGDGTS